MSRRRTVAIASAAVLTGMAGTLVAGEVGPLAGARQEVPVSGPLQFNASGPVRVFDSRTEGTPISSTGYGARMIDLSGFVPANTRGAMVNVTVVADGETTGYVSLTGERDPGTSNISWTSPGVYSNLALPESEFACRASANGARSAPVGSAGADVALGSPGSVSSDIAAAVTPRAPISSSTETVKSLVLTSSPP